MIVKLWIGILNCLSALEFRLADRFGEMPAILAHFLTFWGIPVVLLYLPWKFCDYLAIAIALFYVFILAGDIMLSVFGHEKLERKQGMIDISSVHEMREEIIGALVKYLGGVVSFATAYNALQQIYNGRAFIIGSASRLPYFDLLYYSMITITTVGYGDIQPAVTLAKAMAMTEIAFGLGFVLLLFTMMISIYIDIQRKKKSD